ncbi:MAG: preprotein translocase subunit SecE [Chloroflexi bacterium]|nr:preprotein translocase subunit SecE [Chloroflexota bacterium]
MASRSRPTPPVRRRDGTKPSTAALPREVISELRKVTWPSRQEAWRLTMMVLAVSAVIGVFLGIVDYAFSLLVTRTLVG